MRALRTLATRDFRISHVSRRGGGLILAGIALLALLSGCSLAKVTAAPGHHTGMMPMSGAATTAIKTDILMSKPNGPSDNWPAYVPSAFTVPANSTVTVTIRNFDLGDTDLPKDSPFTTVQGTVGGLAYVDGKAYASLAPAKVAHTFTIPQLHLNVPIPGDAGTGKPFVTVSFSFHTGAAGMYMFQCFDPCGTDPGGWGGPMATMGYMQGMVTVAG